MANAKVMEDAAYRARLIAEARLIVSLKKNSKHLSNSRRPAAERLPLNECHAQNGAAK
jgi:hypothetical protein